MEDTYFEEFEDAGNYEDDDIMDEAFKSPTATLSQDSINLDPAMNVLSDFLMQADKDKQDEAANVEAMFAKEISEYTVEIKPDTFAEGEVSGSAVAYEFEEEYEEAYDEYADYEEWDEVIDHQPSDIGSFKQHREMFKRRSNISGDFGVIQEQADGWLGVTTIDSYVTLKSEGESIKSVEEVKEEIEEEEEPIDREPYYELYKSLMQEYPLVKMKNNFLQRKMAEYFKKRKMEHVLREAERIGDAEEKYYSKLDALWELKNTNDIQRNALSSELNEMKELRNKQYNSVITNFEAMLAREKEIGTGLIFTKTAKEIPEKFLERLIKNQRLKSNEITDMRLRYIKLRNSIDEITAAIRAMDKIGENHTLIDYEQLKMENQNYSDKIEERDEELSKLREKCSGAIQILAHLREKSAAMDIDILEMAERLEEAVFEKNQFRERVVELKHERDTVRSNIVKLQEESGLLTKRKLLLDMEDTLTQINNIKNEVAKIEQTYKENVKGLDIIKHNIKIEREVYHKKAYKLEDQRAKSKLKKICKVKSKFCTPGLEKFKIDL